MILFQTLSRRLPVYNFMKAIMKRKGFITGIMLLSVLIAAFIVRAFYIVNIMDKVNVEEQLLSTAMLEGQGIVVTDIFANGFSARTVYVLCMSFSCMIFGNFAVAGVYLNVGLQILTVLMLFSIGKNFFNRYLGIILGSAYAVIPMVVNQVSRVNEINMKILFAVALVWLVSAAVCLLRRLHSKNKAKALIMEENTEKMTENEQEIQAQTTPVRDSSMKEIILEEAAEQKPRFIENPLPVPKRRAHREMDYAIETDANDDYDITDMTGKDFFDIE